MASSPSYLSLLLILILFYPVLLYEDMIPIDSTVDVYSLPVIQTETAIGITVPQRISNNSIIHQGALTATIDYSHGFSHQPTCPASTVDQYHANISTRLMFDSSIKTYNVSYRVEYIEFPGFALNSGVSALFKDHQDDHHLNEDQRALTLEETWMEKTYTVSNAVSYAFNFSGRLSFSARPIALFKDHQDDHHLNGYSQGPNYDSLSLVSFWGISIIIAGVSSFTFLLFFARLLWRRRRKTRANLEEENGYTETTMRQWDKSKLQIPEKALNYPSQSKVGVNVVTLQFDSNEVPRNTFRDSAINSIKN